MATLSAFFVWCLPATVVGSILLFGLVAWLTELSTVLAVAIGVIGYLVLVEVVLERGRSVFLRKMSKYILTLPEM